MSNEIIIQTNTHCVNPSVCVIALFDSYSRHLKTIRKRERKNKKTNLIKFSSNCDLLIYDNELIFFFIWFREMV